MNDQIPKTVMQNQAFRKDLRDLLNRHSMENGSNTPDGLLADYLAMCLDAFDMAVDRREAWYSRCTTIS